MTTFNTRPFKALDDHTSFSKLVTSEFYIKPLLLLSQVMEAVPLRSILLVCNQPLVVKLCHPCRRS